LVTKEARRENTRKNRERAFIKETDYSPRYDTRTRRARRRRATEATVGAAESSRVSGMLKHENDDDECFATFMAQLTMRGNRSERENRAVKYTIGVQTLWHVWIKVWRMWPRTASYGTL